MKTNKCVIKTIFELFESGDISAARDLCKRVENNFEVDSERSLSKSG